jgi:hypothetical protein
MRRHPEGTVMIDDRRFGNQGLLSNLCILSGLFRDTLLAATLGRLAVGRVVEKGTTRAFDEVSITLHAALAFAEECALPVTDIERQPASLTDVTDDNGPRLMFNTGPFPVIVEGRHRRITLLKPGSHTPCDDTILAVFVTTDKGDLPSYVRTDLDKLLAEYAGALV